LSLAQFQLRKFFCGTDGKHFYFLISLGKESWFWLQAVPYASGQIIRLTLKPKHEELGQAVSARTFLGVDLGSSSYVDT
jgi:hypothetical protein